MSISVAINDAGQAVLLIADVAYRFRLAPRGLSLWALEVTRADTGATYQITEETPGKWTCTCPAMTYRKRGAPPCKHCLAAMLLRSWLRNFTVETALHVEHHPARIA